MPIDRKKRNAEICGMREHGLTYAAIGKVFDLSRSRIERIVSTAIADREMREIAHRRVVGKSIEEMPLSDFLLLNSASARLRNGLSKCEEYRTVGDVLRESERQLLKIPHLSRVSIRELREVLGKQEMVLEGNL